MQYLVLLHGAWHGSWCWNKLVPILKNHNYNCITPDMHGATNTCWQDYVDELRKTIINKEKIILIAHSMAGVIASLLAEQVPNIVEKLIYISAFALTNKENISQYVKMDNNVDLAKLIIYLNKDHTAINPIYAGEKFYNRCTPDDINFAISNLRSQNIRIFKEKIYLTDNFSNIPKYYIACTQDNIISVAVQKTMANNVKCKQLIAINSDHSPFFSNEENLANILLQICGEVAA